MERYPKSPKKESNSSVSSKQQSDEPNSAHATAVAENYVKKRKEKAEKQTIEGVKSNPLWSSNNYVIL